MPVHRKRFRIEEIQTSGTPIAGGLQGDVLQSHSEIMNELRVIRAQMAAPHSATHDRNLGSEASPDMADAQALLQNYRAHMEQCEKLKVELDLIHDAINRTKEEIALLYGKSFSGEEMSRVTGELDEVVGGTELATQKILEAAEAIDQAGSALAKKISPDQQAQLSEDIQERVVAIFEACNFQDLTGQRIGKVMNTMKFIEQHINAMMDIWGGVDAIKLHAPPITDTRVGDARLLNGPKGKDENGHASQDDIDAMFD